MTDLEEFCATKADGNYAHPDDPTKFISCVAQTHGYERRCPQGYTYDEASDSCVAPDGSVAPAR